MIKVKGYVICMPVKTWGKVKLDPWYVVEYTFGKTVTEAWINLMNIQPHDDDWDRKQTYWINRGYCVKEATLEVISE